MAKYFEAHVTGVCSTANLELVKSLGTDALVDYTKTDLTITSERYNIVFDTVGKFPNSKTGKVLLEKDRYVSTHTSLKGKKREYLDFICELASKGMIKPVLDKLYSLNNIREAHTYVETGRKKGNVVILVRR